METLDILYIFLGVAVIISLLCGELVFKACDEHQQRQQNLRDQVRHKQLSPKTIGPTTTVPLLTV